MKTHADTSVMLLRLSELDLNATDRRILRLIRGNSTISRSDLVLATGLSKGMLSKTVKKLLDTGLVLEARALPKLSQVGQPVLQLSFNGSLFRFVGLNMSVRGCWATVTDFDGSAVWVSNEHPLPSDRNQIVELARRLAADGCAAANQPTDIGFHIPGMVSFDGEITEIAPHLREIPYVEIREMLHTDHPNASIVVGRASILFEAFQPNNFNQTLFYLSLGDGIGGRIFDREHVFGGGYNDAGNVGALVPESGLRPSLPDLANFLDVDPKLLTMEQLHELERAHDPRLFEWIESRAPMLTHPLSAVVQLINPHKIIIGGNFPQQILARIAALIDLSAYDFPGRRTLTKPAIHIATNTGERGRAIAASLLPVAKFFDVRVQ